MPVSTTTAGRVLEDRVARQLTKAGFRFVRQPVMGGLRPDFLITGPGEQRVVVETKAWNPVAHNIARAAGQAAYYQALAGADKAFVVLPPLGGKRGARGVVGADDLVDAVATYFTKPSTADVKARVPRRHTRVKPRRAAKSRSIFAAMPFDGNYDDTYLVAMSYAAERVGATCDRVDKEEFSGDIVEEIKRLITASAGVIVDLSEGKANVLYEAGFAHALGKPTVHICSTPLAELPFDVRNWNTVAYTRGQTSKLKEPLARRLRALL